MRERSSPALPQRTDAAVGGLTPSNARVQGASGPGASRSTSKTVTVPIGTRLIDAIVRAKLPIAGACGADGLCGRCGVAVVSGAPALAPETEDEARIKSRNRIDPKLRLACRTLVSDDLEISASYW